MGSLWIVRNKKVKTQVVEHKVVSINLRKWPAIENVHLWAVMSAAYHAGREHQENSPKLDGKGGEGVLYIGELEADLEMELLDPEYIAVEDLIERGDDRPEQYHDHEQSLRIVG